MEPLTLKLDARPDKPFAPEIEVYSTGNPTDKPFAPEIVVYSTGDPTDKLDEIADIIAQANKDINRVLQDMQSGKLKDLPAELFERYADMEWVRNLPNLAKQGVLTPGALTKRLMDSPIRSKNDAKLLLLATEFCAQEATMRFGTALTHAFGNVYEQAVKSKESIQIMLRTANSTCKNVLGVDLGLGEDNSGLELKHPSSVTSHSARHIP